MNKTISILALTNIILLSTITQSYAWSPLPRDIKVEDLTLEKIIPEFYIQYSFQPNNMIKNSFNHGTSVILNDVPSKLIELDNIKSFKNLNNKIQYDVTILSYDIIHGKVDRKHSCTTIKVFSFQKDETDKYYKYLQSNEWQKNCEE